MSCGRPWNKSNTRKAKELSIFYFNGTIVPFNDFTTTTEKKKSIEFTWGDVGFEAVRDTPQIRKKEKKKRRDT